MSRNILKNHLSIEQLILMEVYKRENEPTTIDELISAVKAPRTTVVEHLNLLEREGLLSVSKTGRVKNYWPEKEVQEHFNNAFSSLTAAYIFALDKIRTNELKELKKAKTQAVK